MQDYKFKTYDTSGMTYSRRMSENYGNGAYSNAFEAYTKSKTFPISLVVAVCLFAVGFILGTLN